MRYLACRGTVKQRVIAPNAINGGSGELAVLVKECSEFEEPALFSLRGLGRSSGNLNSVRVQSSVRVAIDHKLELGEFCLERM